MATELVHWRFTVDEYHRMAEVGILCEHDRVELIDGELINMSPIGSRHAACVDRLDELLREQVARGAAIIRVQSPMRLDEHQEPEPDVAVLRFHEDYYARGMPAPHDVLLIIEVADTSLSYDRGIKLPAYARAGIPESWLVDLPGEAIERHSDPVAGRYRLITRAERGRALESAVLSGLVLQVEDVLG